MFPLQEADEVRVDEGVHEQHFQALIFVQFNVGGLRGFVGAVVNPVLVTRLVPFQVFLQRGVRLAVQHIALSRIRGRYFLPGVALRRLHFHSRSFGSGLAQVGCGAVNQNIFNLLLELVIVH